MTWLHQANSCYVHLIFWDDDHRSKLRDVLSFWTLNNFFPPSSTFLSRFSSPLFSLCLVVWGEGKKYEMVVGNNINACNLFFRVLKPVEAIWKNIARRQTCAGAAYRTRPNESDNKQSTCYISTLIFHRGQRLIVISLYFEKWKARFQAKKKKWFFHAQIESN